jgi:hypothetical protein
MPGIDQSLQRLITVNAKLKAWHASRITRFDEELCRLAAMEHDLTVSFEKMSLLARLSTFGFSRRMNEFSRRRTELTKMRQDSIDKTMKITAMETKLVEQHLVLQSKQAWKEFDSVMEVWPAFADRNVSLPQVQNTKK